MTEYTGAKWLAGIFFTGLLLASGGAQAAYKIAPGDILELNVAGVPDLKLRSVVGLDGEITLPMIKPVMVAGLELVDAQDAVKKAMSQKLFQQRGVDGRENTVAVSPDAVSLIVAEYRPVYLTGDVTKPGEQTYRPGMSVRQAIALAGGYEIMRFRMQNPFLEGSDLRQEYQATWMDFVRLQARIWRIQTELGQSPQPLEKMTQAPLPKTELDGIRQTARIQLDTNQASLKAERAFLLSAVDTSDNQIDLLKSRQAKELENVEVDRAEYMKLKEFSEHGNLPLMRLAEVRRLFLFSSTQSLQTSVQLTSTVRDRDEYRRKAVRIDEDHRTDLLKQLEEANVLLDQSRSKLQAVGEKITYTGVIRSQLVRGGGASPVIRIIRSKANGGANIAAGEDSEVMPGDTVDVALHTEVPEASTN